MTSRTAPFAATSNDELDRLIDEATNLQRIYEEGDDLVDALFAERRRRIKAATVTHQWCAGIQIDLYVNQAEQRAALAA